ncbi:MAG: methyltransferase domain-containing protein [Candidatus Woesearchaeota archaeon]
MIKDFLSLLACPKCRGGLNTEIIEQNRQEVVRAKLTCTACNTKYSMEDGIPDLYYAPRKTLQEGVRKLFNETPYGIVGARDAMEHPEKISIHTLNTTPWYVAESDVRGKYALEAGCGGGHLYTELELLGANVIGIDQTPNSLYHIRKLFIEHGRVPNLVIGNLEYLPFKDNTFDMITSMGVIHHTPNPQACLDHFARALKTTGKIHIMVYHKTSVWNYTKKILRYLCRRSRIFSRLIFALTPLWSGETKTQSNTVTVFRDNMVNPITKSFNARELRDMAEKAGLVLQKVDRRELPELYVMGKRVYQSRLLRWYEKRFGWFLLASMSKKSLW